MNNVTCATTGATNSRLPEQVGADFRECRRCVGVVAGVGHLSNGVDDRLPSRVVRQSEPDDRRVAERHQADTHLAAINVQLTDDADDVVDQLDELGGADRCRVVDDEYDVRLVDARTSQQQRQPTTDDKVVTTWLTTTAQRTNIINISIVTASR